MPLYIYHDKGKARSTRAVVKGEKMSEEKIERFLVEPNLSPVFGQTITKDTELDVWTEDKKVHQIIKDLTITTISEDGTETDNYDMKFKSEMTLKIKDGTRLLWTETQGYVLPSHQRLMTREELKAEIDELDNIEGLE